MSRHAAVRDQRGFCAIGIEHGKAAVNLGTLWRSADLLGASLLFTVGKRYSQQASDTMKSWRNLPLLHFADVDDLIAHLPYSCPLVGIELDDRAKPLDAFYHPERAAYLLGAEDHGLSNYATERCHSLILLPGRYSMNVAVAGSIVLYDRVVKQEAKKLRLVS